MQKLDYEILKAASEMNEQFIDKALGSVLSLAALNLSLNKKIACISEIQVRANYLARAGLIVMAQQIGHVSHLTAEGRILLDRMESNRWQSKWSERAIGVLITIMAGLMLAAVIYFLNLNGNASGVTK